MVKLTNDLINQAIQYVNPLRERELLLRGYKIPVIENLGATLDQFDAIDFSDNDIRKLDGFPYLSRLQTLHFNNNRICRIDEHIHVNIPNLKELYLTNCELREFSDLDNLVEFKKLEYLSVMQNPVALKKNYRLYVIYRMPQIRILDFQRIKMKERNKAKEFFGSKSGQQIMSDIDKKKISATEGSGDFESDGVSKANKEAIREAIMKASTLEEVEKLRQLLQSGQIPGAATNGKSQNGSHQNAADVEMEVE